MISSLNDIFRQGSDEPLPKAQSLKERKTSKSSQAIPTKLGVQHASPLSAGPTIKNATVTPQQKQPIPAKETNRHNTPHVSSQPKTRVRKERADKKKDMKFPVTPEQRENLRKRASELRIADRRPDLKYETISNTAILMQAMEHYAVFPEQYPPLTYKDTGQYMHAELLLPDYKDLEALAQRLNLSIRKTVHRLIMNFIFCGDVDIHAYRKTQQQQPKCL